MLEEIMGGEDNKKKMTITGVTEQTYVHQAREGKQEQ